MKNLSPNGCQTWVATQGMQMHQHQCKRAVVADGKCSIHSNEAKEKRYRKQEARYARQRKINQAYWLAKGKQS